MTGSQPQVHNLPAVPSGPNSVPSQPLPDQQTFVPSPQQAAGVLEATDPQGQPVDDVPPSSTTTRSFAACVGLDNPHHP